MGRRCLFSLGWPPGVEIREISLTRHEFTNLLTREIFNFLAFYIPRKKALPHLQKKLTVLKKTKMKLTLKKVSKVVHFTNFLFKFSNLLNS